MPALQTNLGIKRIYFSRTNAQKKSATAAIIGGRTMGRVYAGKVVLPNGKKQAVAIKLFKTALSAEQAKRYQTTIEDLRAAGVKIPRMAMVKLPKGTPLGSGALQHEMWAQISQLFGSVKRGSKIQKINTLTFPTPETRMQATQELTKIANAGYLPVEDSINIMRTKRGIEIIPADIDYIVYHGKQSVERRAKLLAQTILKITNGPTEEYSKLLEAAIRTANPRLREYLEKEKLS